MKTSSTWISCKYPVRDYYSLYKSQSQTKLATNPTMPKAEKEPRRSHRPEIGTGLRANDTEIYPVL